jgi:hypothetical protein
MSPYALRFVAGYFIQRFKLRGLVLAKQPDIAPLLRRHRIMNWFTTFCPSPVQVEQDRRVQGCYKRLPACLNNLRRKLRRKRL